MQLRLKQGPMAEKPRSAIFTNAILDSPGYAKKFMKRIGLAALISITLASAAFCKDKIIVFGHSAAVGTFGTLHPTAQVYKENTINANKYFSGYGIEVIPYTKIATDIRWCISELDRASNRPWFFGKPTLKDHDCDAIVFFTGLNDALDLTPRKASSNFRSLLKKASEFGKPIFVFNIPYFSKSDTLESQAAKQDYFETMEKIRYINISLDIISDELNKKLGYGSIRIIDINSNMERVGLSASMPHPKAYTKMREFFVEQYMRGMNRKMPGKDTKQKKK